MTDAFNSSSSRGVDIRGLAASLERARTAADKLKVRNAFIDHLMAEVPAWAGLLAQPEGPKLQNARDLFTDVLMALDRELGKIDLPLSDEVKRRLAEAKTAISEAAVNWIRDIAHNNSGAAAVLSREEVDQLLAACRSAQSQGRKFDA